MVRMRYREKPMRDGDEVEIGDNAIAVSIYIEPDGDRRTFVTWLEEMPFEDVADDMEGM